MAQTIFATPRQCTALSHVAQFPSLPKNPQRASKAGWAKEVLHIKVTWNGGFSWIAKQMVTADEIVAVYFKLWS